MIPFYHASFQTSFFFSRYTQFVNFVTCKLFAFSWHIASFHTSSNPLASVLTVKLVNLYLHPTSKSLIHIVNSSSLSTDHGSIPPVTNLNVTPFITACCFLVNPSILIYYHQHNKITFCVSRCWRYLIQIYCIHWFSCIYSSWYFVKFIRYNFPFIKPCWICLMKFWLSKWFVIISFIINSNIFPTITSGPFRKNMLFLNTKINYLPLNAMLQLVQYVWLKKPTDCIMHNLNGELDDWMRECNFLWSG